MESHYLTRSKLISSSRGTKRKLATMEESESFSSSGGPKRGKLATVTLEGSDDFSSLRDTKCRKSATISKERDNFNSSGGTKRGKLARTSKESDVINSSCSSNNPGLFLPKTNSKSRVLNRTPRSSMMKDEIPSVKSILTSISSSSGTKRRKFSPNSGFHKTNSRRQNLVPSIMNEEGKCLNLVGMRDQLLEVDKLLDLGSCDVRFIGIVGMGGSGKTTIAKSVYKKLKPMFGYTRRCFLNVSGKLVSLQKKLLSKLCGGKVQTTIKNEGHGAELIQNCLRGKKVFIVLDGVKDGTKLKKLAGSPDWFSPGSRIMITTQNKNLCSQQPTSYEYNVKLLDHHSAFTLFCNHAFGVGYEPPDENFKYLAEEFVKMAQGHPSALITIGSHLHGKDIDIWEENIKTVDQLLYTRLFHHIFNTSYRGLDVESQQIFLDLACFFHNWTSVNRVIEILESFGYASPSRTLKSLAQRNLINVSFDNIQMHSLIVCMGRGIAQGENGCSKTRFWLREDIHRLFHEKEGLNQVRGIVFMEREEEEDELIILEAKSFAYMTELQLLEINNNNIQISDEIKFLSNELRLLNWDGYPSKCLPSNFEPPWLLELHLRNSQLERLWEGQKAFSCLKEMDLSGSEYLVETPDLSKLPNLQRLILQNCVRLCVVHPSINTLNRLVLVDMAGCLSLKTFSSNRISSRSLQTLILSDSGLESFPEIESCTQSLTELHVDGTLIHDLPMSLEHLTTLTLLNLKDCTKLSTLPESICRLISLQTLNLNGCIDLQKIPFTLGTIPSLTKLDIGGTSLIDHHCEERLSRNNNIWWSLSTGNYNNNVLLLRDLNLSECNLVDEDIPNDLKCLSLLEILDLSKNSFVRLKQSLTQLTNLKALCLDDCIHLQPQLLPTLPTSLQYVGGLQNTNHISHNAQGSSCPSASSPSNPVRIVKEIESASDDSKDSPEEVYDDIDNVKITRKLISKLSTDYHSKIEKVCGKYLVGMEEQLENVRALLDINESDEARFLWICGVAGIGKTSIAEVIYSEIVDKFESSCFLHILEKKNLVSLQKQLLSQLLLKDEIEVLDEDDGAKMIENHMKSRRTLIVLDDIDEKRQVEKLVGSPVWFGPGSRIIITTRNRETVTGSHQLINYKMQEYNVKLLSQQSAHSLFCKYAFGNCVDPEKNEYLSTEIVKKVGRLPGLLIFIGSALHNKDVAVWKQTLTILCNVQQDFFSAIAN